MTSLTRIKMCGTTNIDDATAAASLGVDALGFIFAPKSPRYISPQDGVKVVADLPPFIFKIGVFVDEDLKEINEIIRFLGLNSIQLHGNESEEFCKEIGKANPTCAILKAFRVGEHTQTSDFVKYREVVDGFVLDTYVKGVAGGTGKTFDWSLLNNLHINKPVVLAGGLDQNNVVDAIKAVSPYCVDVNSGVEHAPGVKDHIKLARFVNNVRNMV